MTEAPSPTPALFDVNALLALTLTSHVHHRAAHAFLADQERWFTCPTTEAGLCRLLLNPTVTGASWTFRDVAPVLRGFRRDGRWGLLPEDKSLTDAIVDTAVLVGHRQVTDLRLVDLAARCGAELATFDRAMTEWLSPSDRAHVRLIPVEIS